VVALRTTVPSTRQTSFVTESSDDRPVPIALRGAPKFESGGTFFVYQNQLSAVDPVALAQHRQIRLFVAGPEGDPHRHDGELVLTGSGCRYRAQDGEGTAGIVTFERGAGCVPLNGATGQVLLRLRYRGPAHPVLLAVARAPGDVPAIALRVSRFGLPAAPDVLVAKGTAVRFLDDPGASRLALLAYVWEIGSSGRWIATVVAGAGVAMALAVLLLWRSPRPDADRGLARVIAAGFLAALSLGGLYAVLTPPMQAADEPSHFLTLAEYLENPALATAAEAWARRGHFEEIRFHTDRTFSPADRGTPGRAWTGMAPASFFRGSGIQALWWVMAPVVRHLPPPQLLLTLRLVSAGLFAASVALFVFAVGRGAAADVADLLALPLFLIPTLPYFAMQMSNYGPLTSAYVALAAAVVIASWQRGGAAAGALLGSSFAIANILSRSAVPLAPCVAAVLLARALTGDSDRPSRPRWPFWLAVAVTLGVGIAVAREPYLAYLNMRESVGAQVAGVKRAVNATPWLAVLAAAAGWGLEAAIGAVRRRLSRDGRQGTTVPVGSIAAASAAVLLLMMLGSLVVRYPRLELIDPANPPSIRSYVGEAVVACATFLRFGRPDPLTSLTFWGGFGWLDVVLPASLVGLLAGASGLALVLLLVWTARAKDGRMLVWLACAAAGFVLSAAAYAVSVIALTPADLHGRYLLGLYLLVLTVSWSSLARFERSGWLRGSGVVRAAGGAAAGCPLRDASAGAPARGTGRRAPPRA